MSDELDSLARIFEERDIRTGVALCKSATAIVGMTESPCFAWPASNAHSIHA